MEELTATINEISNQVKENVENAIIASKEAGAAGHEVLESNPEMQELIEAMANISHSSQEIGKVIKTIEDIVFQTKILALNAAVEAARGSCRQGFCRGNGRGSEFGKQKCGGRKGTTALIEGTVAAVANGTKLADDTAKWLDTVVQGTTEVEEIINKIANASNEQANAVTRVTMGVDQTSSVVQSNSATAEESAAAFEELSGQASMLRQLVAKFNLGQYTEKLASVHASNELEFSGYGNTNKY